ncbi:hypothetical protein PR202_ga16531 [Eleusine coracana subsp. coracana]|uniref:Uncharacterized protein n=1 Tax=Eleusine coracana subsp. coracana TaxID=191504 RepID=A0AAV5CMH1_ELECO|nr:hypothetical protein PR202_ga16531 [Eleusine coracana subsp. coracana]
MDGIAVLQSRGSGPHGTKNGKEIHRAQRILPPSASRLSSVFSLHSAACARPTRLRCPFTDTGAPGNMIRAVQLPVDGPASPAMAGFDRASLTTAPPAAPLPLPPRHCGLPNI